MAVQQKIRGRMDMTSLQRFFVRIGMEPDTNIEHSAAFLGQLQSNAVQHIAYENLDILVGKPLDLSAGALFEKIVLRGRGGYCFETNGLLADMLRQMGFSVSERFARFLRGETGVPMRRHRLCVVKLPEGDHMCDIGIGQRAPRFPLKIEEDLVQKQNGEIYRFRKDPVHGWVLEEMYHGAWRDYLSFGDDEAFPIDFVQPSYYCEKHPDSVFNKWPKLAIKTVEGRCTVDDRVYKEFLGEELVHMEENISDERFTQLCRQVFFLNLDRSE